MDRRSFIQRSMGAAMTGLAIPSVLGCSSSKSTPDIPQLKKQKVGVQLYTLRSIVGDDFPAVLKQVADVGYSYLEFAGYYDHSPADLRKIIDDLGLKAASGHFGIQLFEEGADEVIQGALALGMTHVIVPALPDEMKSSVDALKATSARLNVIGEACKNAGLQFGYHNHWQEFEEVEGELPWDILLSETQSDLVKMELDLAWATRGGADLLELIAADPGRYELFHVKDLTPEGELADVGHGTLDFPALFSKADVAGLEYAIVEHDRPTEPVASITNSFEYLKKIGVA